MEYTILGFVLRQIGRMGFIQDFRLGAYPPAKQAGTGSVANLGNFHYFGASTPFMYSSRVIMMFSKVHFVFVQIMGYYPVGSKIYNWLKSAKKTGASPAYFVLR